MHQTLWKTKRWQRNAELDGIIMQQCGGEIQKCETWQKVQSYETFGSFEGIQNLLREWESGTKAGVVEKTDVGKVYWQHSYKPVMFRDAWNHCLSWNTVI